MNIRKLYIIREYKRRTVKTKNNQNHLLKHSYRAKKILNSSNFSCIFVSVKTFLKSDRKNL